VGSGGVAVDTVIEAGGSATVQSGGVASGSIVSSGGVQVVLSGGLTSGMLLGSGGTARVLSGGVVSGAVLQSGGVLDFQEIGYVDGGLASFDALTGVLTVAEGLGSATVQLVGDYSGVNFHILQDGDGSTLISTVPCYCAATLIATDRGEVAVEALRVGDRVIARGGAARPVRWIGRRGYGARFVAANRAIQPIRIRAGALGAGVPRRDLFVSPLHALLFLVAGREVLVPAEALVDGAGIARCAEYGDVLYFHVELDSHDAILAEGAWAESFVDCDSRGMFINAAEHAALNPGRTAAPCVFFTEVSEEGPVLEAIRTRLSGVATRPPGPMRGHLDLVSGGLVEGWVQDLANPERGVALELVLADGTVLPGVANRYRADLEKVGIGLGRHAYRFELPKGAEVVAIRRAGDGVVVPGGSKEESSFSEEKEAKRLF
jgi:autotransporter passenger strand-loop-strand repeat protein